MGNHASKECVDKLMGKILRHAELWAMARAPEFSHNNLVRNETALTERCRDEAKEVETDIENSLYVALDTRFIDGYDQGWAK